MSYAFLKNEKKNNREQVTFIGDTMNIYIPESYLKDGLAYESGNLVNTMGIFIFSVGSKKYQLNLPVNIDFEFSLKEKKDMKLKPEIKSEMVYIYTLKRGDAFIYDILHKKSVDNIYFFFNKMIDGAKMPNFVSYDDIIRIILSILKFYDNSLNVSSLVFEALIAESCRCKNSLTTPLRLSSNIDNDMYKYKMLKSTKVPEFTSTFTGFIGEDTKQQLISGIVKNRENLQEPISPLERLIKQ